MYIYLKALLKWLPLGVAISIIFGFIFISAQQVVRAEANSVIIDTARNAIEVLEADANVIDSINNGQEAKIDLAKSHKVFFIVYKEDKSVAASTAALDGKTPELPSGVLDNVKDKGTAKITWAPKKDARQAAVIYKVGGQNPGFLLVGRSLKDTDEIVTKLAWTAFAGWLIAIAASLLTKFILAYAADRKNNPKPVKKSKSVSESTSKEDEEKTEDKPKAKSSSAKAESESKTKTTKVEKVEEKSEPADHEKKAKKTTKTESK